MGLVSDGGVHSHINHLKALLTMLADNNLVDVYLHAFTDGRDTDPHSGKDYLKDIERHMKNTTGKVVSICGRYFSMDRDNRWERTQKAYNLIVRGEGRQFKGHASDAIQSAYDLGQTDEFISPIQIEPIKICDNDIVLFFNFRTDRGRQLTKVLSQQDFSEIDMFKLKTQFFPAARFARRKK